MKFRHRIERININGLKEYSVQYYITEQLFIGRGSSCQIRLPYRSVGIRHARLTTNADDSVTIHDLTEGKSILKVNGRNVKKRALAKGDKVQIGELHFETFFDGSFWGFRETRMERDESVPKSDIQRELRKLDLASVFPKQTLLCLLSMSLVVLFFFAEPATGKHVMLWSSGPISNAHRLIGMNCQTCHKVPFQPVRDVDCAHCHKMSQHSPILPAVFRGHPGLSRRCAECHSEHNGGARPVETDSSECVRCHADLSRLSRQIDRPKVTSFDDHPEFAVSSVQFDGDEAQRIIKTVLGKGEQDSTRLAFGHSRHLAAGLRGLAIGKEALKCGDCHIPAPNRREMQPVTYVKQCASCHPLGFDERLPDKQVPHGDSGGVYNFIYAEYSKLFLVSEQRNERLATVRRIKPGTTVIDEPDLKFTREFVESESRNTEKEIFTRTGCKLCHQVVEKPEKPAGDAWFRVLTPYLPVRWFASANFDHSAHSNVSCLSCHAHARESNSTGDVLLPQVQTCKTCHTSQKEHPFKVESSCVSCHSFHDSLKVDESERRTVANFLLGR